MFLNSFIFFSGFDDSVEPIVSPVAKALIKAGFNVEERVEPVQGRRYYYKLKSVDLKQYKRTALRDLADAKKSMLNYEERYNKAKKRVETLEALIDSMGE